LVLECRYHEAIPIACIEIYENSVGDEISVYYQYTDQNKGRKSRQKRVEMKIPLSISLGISILGFIRNFLNSNFLVDFHQKVGLKDSKGT